MGPPQCPPLLSHAQPKQLVRRPRRPKLLSNPLLAPLQRTAAGLPAAGRGPALSAWRPRPKLPQPRAPAHRSQLPQLRPPSHASERLLPVRRVRTAFLGPARKWRRLPRGCQLLGALAPKIRWCRPFSWQPSGPLLARFRPARDPGCLPTLPARRSSGLMAWPKLGPLPRRLAPSRLFGGDGPSLLRAIRRGLFPPRARRI